MPQARCVLIGGFLGAGKTTAMVRFARHLTGQGLRVGLITNDQSVGLVDTARARHAGFPVTEITGGCFCCKFDSLVQAARQLARETAPDVLIAEPVGSCTDIRATVCYPLRQLYGTDFQVAPLSVLVDPIRCARLLGLTAGSNFSEKVRYVYRKQLEEAELLVVNKVDLLDAAGRQRLAEALGREFPRARILEVSCQTGEGVEAWFAAMRTDTLGHNESMYVDYDIYAEGEALLGWLNATAAVTAEAPFDGNAFLQTLAQQLRRQLAALNAEIAHLKMTLLPDEGPDLAAVSLTRTDADPQPTHTLRAPLQRGELTLNLRAQADPAQLRQAVQTAVAAIATPTITLSNINAFSPSRPSPTHRMPLA